MVVYRSAMSEVELDQLVDDGCDRRSCSRKNRTNHSMAKRARLGPGWKPRGASLARRRRQLS